METTGERTGHPTHNGHVARARRPKPRGVVVIGASAGGLEVLSGVIAGLSTTFPLPIVLVLHRALGDTADHLVQILRRFTTMRVLSAHNGSVLERGTLYVAPPGQHTLINHEQRIEQWQGAPIHHVRPSADPLFASGAAVYGPGAIAVVLSGGDDDGSMGVRMVRAGGGTVIAQDEATSRVFGMPAAAAATGLVDAVLPAEEIAGALERLAHARTTGGTHRRQTER